MPELEREVAHRTDSRREAEIQRAVVRFCETLGCVVISFRSLHSAKKARPKQARGIPDLKVFVPQHRAAFWFEVKRPGAVLSEAQRRFQQVAEQCGEPCIWGGVMQAAAFLAQRGVTTAPGGAPSP